MPGARVHSKQPHWLVGDGTGMHAYYTFLLLKADEGCHIVTEEVVKGLGAVEFHEKQPSAMHDGHNLW